MNDDATQIDPSRMEALEATQAAPSNGGTKFTAPASVTRTTVLPRVEADGARVSLTRIRSVPIRALEDPRNRRYGRGRPRERS
jgi:hypothetical protein